MIEGVAPRQQAYRQCIKNRRIGVKREREREKEGERETVNLSDHCAVVDAEALICGVQPRSPLGTHDAYKKYSGEGGVLRVRSR